MVCTYEEYLKQSKAITFEKMQTIHTEILSEIGADTGSLELYNAFTFHKLDSYFDSLLFEIIAYGATVAAVFLG